MRSYVNWRTVCVLLLVLSATFLIPNRVSAQSQNSVWTDKTVYNVGETVTIYVSPPPPNFGVSEWLVVTKPDQSQVRLDLAGGQQSTTMIADMVGHYRVGLWGQAVVPNSTPQLLAGTYFEVKQQITPQLLNAKFRAGVENGQLQSRRDCVKNLFWFNDRYVLEDRKAGMDVVVEVRCLLRLVVLVVSCFPI